MSEGDPVVADFSDVSINADGNIWVGSRLLDLTELELFFNKLSLADKVIIRKGLLESFINFYPEAFDKKEIELV